MSEKIYIFDTTLRDGEQAPRCSLTAREKMQVAFQLERLGVDIIEAGFAASSPGDFASVKEIAEAVKKCSVASLARCKKEDIEAAGKALQNAAKPRIHVFLATSEIHMKHKLRKSQDEVLAMACDGVRLARTFVEDVEFSAEDASRSDKEFLCKVVEEVINAGARTVNIPDTTGYAIPQEYGALIAYIFKHVPNIGKAVISVHCHNDLGMGVANSLAAVSGGARQIECTVNGLGERAGNASLEEIVMAIQTRKDFFGDLYTGIDTKQLVPASRLVRTLTGVPVPPNKAVVGDNAFAHESGIHQDGILKERLTYEIMSPQDVGWDASKLILGKHSGRHAFRERLGILGFELADNDMDKAFAAFKELADKKKEIFDEDLIAIVEDQFSVNVQEDYKLRYLSASSGNTMVPTATVILEDSDGKQHQDASCGDGPVDAVYKTVDRITGIKTKLVEYSLRAVTSGKDAQGEAVLALEYEGKTFAGKASSTDTIEASAKAYLNAVNKIIKYRRSHQDQ